MGKKITIICISYPPEKGAAPTRIYNMAKSLRAAGHQVQVITAMPNYPVGQIFPEFRGKMVHTEEKEDILIRRLWLYPSNSKNPVKRIMSMFSYTFSLYMLALPKILMNRPDIAIVSSPPLLSGYAGIIIARLARCKTVLNISDIWPSTALELGAIKRGKFYNLLEFIEKRMYALSHVYVGQSKEILAHIHKVLPSNKKQFLYRNLQERPAIKPSGRPPGKKRIVYAGLLGVAQGVLEICKTIDFGSMGLEFHIYGDGFEKEAVKEYASANPQREIYYHDSISGAEVPGMLSQYHATIVPLKTSIHGAVPSKIFMAVANTIPIFFSGNGEGAKIVKEGGIGWVSAPGDYDALRQNIRSLVNMPEAEYAAVCNNCRNLSEGLYNKETQDAAFNDFLNSL